MKQQGWERRRLIWCGFFVYVSALAPALVGMPVRPEGPLRQEVLAHVVVAIVVAANVLFPLRTTTKAPTALMMISAPCTLFFYVNGFDTLIAPTGFDFIPMLGGAPRGLVVMFLLAFFLAGSAIWPSVIPSLVNARDRDPGLHTAPVFGNSGVGFSPASSARGKHQDMRGGGETGNGNGQGRGTREPSAGSRRSHVRAAETGEPATSGKAAAEKRSDPGSFGWKHVFIAAAVGPIILVAATYASRISVPGACQAALILGDQETLHRQTTSTEDVRDKSEPVQRPTHPDARGTTPTQQPRRADRPKQDNPGQRRPP
jgi:hypothetical protein